MDINLLFQHFIYGIVQNVDSIPPERFALMQGFFLGSIITLNALMFSGFYLSRVFKIKDYDEHLLCGITMTLFAFGYCTFMKLISMGINPIMDHYFIIYVLEIMTIFIIVNAIFGLALALIIELVIVNLKKEKSKVELI